MNKRPAVGVAIGIVKDQKMLFGKRKGSHAAGTWAFPGGYLEWKESLTDCCHREVKEETGLEIRNLRFWCVTNDVFDDEDKHCITIIYLAEHVFGDPKIMEPDKCEEWAWFAWENMPSPLMKPIENLKKNYSNYLHNVIDIPRHVVANTDRVLSPEETTSELQQVSQPSEQENVPIQQKND